MTNANLILGGGSVCRGGGSPFLGGGSHNSGGGSHNVGAGSQIRGAGSQTRRDPAEFNHCMKPTQAFYFQPCSSRDVGVGSLLYTQVDT